MIRAPFILRTKFPRSMESQDRNVESLSDSSPSDDEDEYEVRVDERRASPSPVYVSVLSHGQTLSDAKDIVGLDELTRSQRERLQFLSAKVGKQRGARGLHEDHNGQLRKNVGGNNFVRKRSFMTRECGMPAELLLRILFEDLFGPDAIDELRDGGRIGYALRLHLVCRDWRDLLQHSDSFWARVLILAPDNQSWDAIISRTGTCYIDFATSRDIDIRVQAQQLGRARSVHILPDAKFKCWNKELADAGRLEHLRFLYMSRESVHPVDLPLLRLDVPHLLDLKIDCRAMVKAPLLQRLWIENEGGFAAVQHLEHLLPQSPSLQELYIDVPRQWYDEDDWTEILAPLSTRSLQKLEIRSNSELSLEHSTSQAIVLPSLISLYSQVPVLIKADRLKTMVVRVGSMHDAISMLRNAPNVRSVKFLECDDVNAATPVQDYLESDNVSGRVTLLNLRSFVYDGLLDGFIVAVLAHLHMPSLRTMDLSMETPPIGITIKPDPDGASVTSIVDEKRLDVQLGHLRALRLTLRRLITGPVVFAAKTSLYRRAQHIDVSFTAKPLDAVVELESWPITIGTSNIQAFCCELAPYGLRSSTARMLEAFASLDVKVMKIEVNLIYGNHVHRDDSLSCCRSLRDCFVPDPFGIAVEDDRSRLGRQLRLMGGIRELDIVMVRSWEDIGLGILEGMMDVVGDEVLLPEVKVIRLTAPPRWFSIRVQRTWWSQLCNVVHQRARGVAHSVKVELVGNFCGCKVSGDVRASLRKLMAAGAEVDLTRTTTLLATIQSEINGEECSGGTVLSCGHCD